MEADGKSIEDQRRPTADRRLASTGMGSTGLIECCIEQEI